jgi:hypothetical protein
VKEGSADGHFFLWRPRWETWERAHMLGAYVWNKVLGQMSLYIGAPLGDLARGGGGPSTRNFEGRMKGALGMGRLSLKRLTAEGPFTGYPRL